MIQKRNAPKAGRRIEDTISDVVSGANINQKNEMSSKHDVNTERVIAYVDGFNLYFGMIQKGYDGFKWLDLIQLAKNLLQPHQQLIAVKYFTSRVSNNPEKQKRQTTYIEALEETGVDIYYGNYQRDNIDCHRCGHIWTTYNEKMTDVNIATQIIIDAYTDKYDMAMLISGDSDLVPPIRAVHANFSKKRVFVAFPPERFNNSMNLVAKGSLVIGRKKLKESQLPEKVEKSNGYILKRPSSWE